VNFPCFKVHFSICRYASVSTTKPLCADVHIELYGVTLRLFMEINDT